MQSLRDKVAALESQRAAAPGAAGASASEAEERAWRLAGRVKALEDANTRLETEAAAVGEREAKLARCPPVPRTNRTRRVPHPVLIGHAASLTPY